MAELTVEEWRAIYKSKKESAVLDIAENDPEGLKTFINLMLVASLKTDPICQMIATSGGPITKECYELRL